MCKWAESFVTRLASLSKKDAHEIDRAAQLLIHSTDPVSMDWLAGQSCLSPERKFKERMGAPAPLLVAKH